MSRLIPILAALALAAGALWFLTRESGEDVSDVAAPPVAEAAQEERRDADLEKVERVTRRPEPEVAEAPAESTGVAAEPEVVEQPPAAPGTTLAGRVLMPDGDVLPGVAVGVVLSAHITLTDEDGAFRLENVPPGERELYVSAGIELEVDGTAHYATGDEQIELVVAAAYARVRGERGGRQVRIEDLHVSEIAGDGSFRPLALQGARPTEAGELDVVLPAGRSVLLHAEDADGVLAAFLETPPSGGRFATAVRETAPGLGDLRVLLTGATAGLEDASLRVALRDRANGAELVAALPCRADTRWTGVVPGDYGVTVALDQAGELGSLAVGAATSELTIEPGAETILSVELVAGGRLELVLPAMMQGMGATPEAGSSLIIDVTAGPGEQPLPLTWRDVSEGKVSIWAARGTLPVGRWRIEARNQHVIMWRGEVTITSGGTARADAR